jgi:hypothetical protein
MTYGDGKIRVLAWDRNKNVVWLNLLMGFIIIIIIIIIIKIIIIIIINSLFIEGYTVS